MSAIHVVVRACTAKPDSSGLSRLYGLFDVVVDGVNLTARIGESQAVPLLAELGQAVGLLANGQRSRVTVPLHSDDEAWELGLEADGQDALISVFRVGPSATVAVHERRVLFRDLQRALLRALSEQPLARTRRCSSRDAVKRALLVPPRLSVRLVETVRWSPPQGQEFGFEAEALLRRAPAESSEDVSLERADLHALLIAGKCRVRARDKGVSLGEVQLFLLAEGLVKLAEESLEAWRLERPLFRRIEIGATRLGIRRGPGESPLALSVTGPAVKSERHTVTFPGLETETLVRGVLDFAERLTTEILARDPGQAKNLRLSILRAGTASLSDQLGAELEDDGVTNPEPDNYRPFAHKRARPDVTGRWTHGAQMRFLPRWVATVPNIDLKASFLCGDRLVVGAERETACIHRQTGEIIWRRSTQRAVSVVTPVGLVRISPDGRTCLHDLGTGEPRFTVRLQPRLGGGAAGAVVHAPGLPKLLVTAEGDRRVSAVDLLTGEIRWRYTARRPASHRMRRAGRLLLVAGEDSAIVALDVVSGEVVWRVRTRLPLSGDVTVDHDAAFALSGTRGGPSHLHHLDPWTGEVRWLTDLGDRHVVGQAPLVTPSAVVIPVRDRRGVGARAFCRRSGAPLWAHVPGLSSRLTAWLAVDDAIVGNSAAGALLCLDASTGAQRFCHVFPRHVAADQPRRLEPILRSGALFVPQHQVYVVRPRDGEVIGTVPTDLIPDLLRVDERCDVYVAEESGHLAAFSVAPKLALVKT